MNVIKALLRIKKDHPHAGADEMIRRLKQACAPMCDGRARSMVDAIKENDGR